MNIKTEYNGSELTGATLTTPTRRVEIEKGKVSGTWSVFLTKISKDFYGDVSERITKTISNLTMKEALDYFDKKQKEYGCFNK